MEKISITRLNQLHPLVRDKALAAYNEAVQATPEGVHPFVTEALRSFKRSNDLYNQPHDGKDNDGDGQIDESDEKVTNAKAGQSYHGYGLAFDFVILIDGKMVWKVDDNWMIVVNIFKKHGFVWGGDFKSIKDAPHLEMTFGYNWRQLLEKYNNKDFIPGTEYVNI